MSASSSSRLSRKRTRSRNESDIQQNNETNDSTTAPSSSSSSDASTLPAPPKRQRHHSSTSGNSYPLRSRFSAPVSSEEATNNNNNTNTRYNLRPRRFPTQVNPSEISPPNETNSLSHSSLSTVAPARQYRLLYISDDDNPAMSTASSNLNHQDLSLTTNNSTHNNTVHRRTSRSTSSTGLQTRLRTATDPLSLGTSTSESSDFSSNNGVGHVRLHRAIEIVIDSIQSLEGAVNNFDQLVFGLIYGRLSSRTELDSFEGMIRLSRILNLNFPSRLSQTEIDALPTIKFQMKPDSSSSSSIHLIEKCPICLTEFYDQETINKLHCTHLFHRSCISTWLSENDSCPTCRRKVNSE